MISELPPSVKGSTQRYRHIPFWQRLLLLAYASFFAGIAPFICWGGLEDPAHPHGNAHFVFQRLSPDHSKDVHGHDVCIHDPMLRQNRLNPQAAEAHTTPTPETRAAPVVTLISLIIILFGTISGWFIRWVSQSQWVNPLQRLQDALLPVPIPPPQMTVLSPI